MIEISSYSGQLKKPKYVHILACRGGLPDARISAYGVRVLFQLKEIELLKGPDAFPREQMIEAELPLHMDSFDDSYQYFLMLATREALPEAIQGSLLRCISSEQALFNGIL